jgi:prepilin-type N-terminal cleavage/methylation domain-containing protein
MRFLPRSALHRRAGYSLLELMIALGLLSVLLLVGWSLMQSIQDAESRSRKLTQRIRVLRTTRAWLSDDMDHLIRSTRPDPLSNAMTTARPVTSNNEHIRPGAEKLDGDATGFIATISPSLDPIRFFDRLVSTSDANGTLNQELTRDWLLASESELAVREARESLWPAHGIDVEYRFEPVNDMRESMQGGIQEAQDIQFELVRREWLMQQANTTDRALNSADLYRGAETAEENYVPPLKETRLYGMVRAEFFYFDGASWSQEWNSVERIGIPMAIAIHFDFPARQDFVRPEASSRLESESDESDFLDPLGDRSTMVLDPTSQESTLGSLTDRMVESSDREVVIIVETGNRARPVASINPRKGFSR